MGVIMPTISKWWKSIETKWCLVPSSVDSKDSIFARNFHFEQQIFHCAFENWDIILFNDRNFETAGHHATNLERGNSICGFFKKRGFTIKYCVGAPEHVRTVSILHIIMFKHQRTQKQTLETHCWPESADFDFWKFWPTNENFKKLKNAIWNIEKYW